MKYNWLSAYSVFNVYFKHDLSSWSFLFIHEARFSFLSFHVGYPPFSTNPVSMGLSITIEVANIKRVLTPCIIFLLPISREVRGYGYFHRVLTSISAPYLP